MARDKALSSTQTVSLSPKDFTFAARDILPTWTSLQPTTIGSKFRTAKTSTTVDCTNVLYNKPDIKISPYARWGQSLTSIITFSLDTPRVTPTIKTVLSNTSQVHVTKNTIYLTAPSYRDYTASCPINARCIMPIWSVGDYTTIHQFSLPSLGYNYSTAVKGTTYSQYSMDDTNGIFKIITSNWQGGKNATNVYTINAQGQPVGKLENIAPNEQFMGTRFIGNNVYLVTYRQIDPLFVISFADIAKPKIL